MDELRGLRDSTFKLVEKARGCVSSQPAAVLFAMSGVAAQLAMLLALVPDKQREKMARKIASQVVENRDAVAVVYKALLDQQGTSS